MSALQVPPTSHTSFQDPLMLNRSALCTTLLVCCALGLFACGNNDTPQNENNPTPDATKDVTKDDGGTKQDETKDDGTPEKDETKDVIADISDETADVVADEEKDEMMFPDVPKDPCAYPSNDPTCPSDEKLLGPGSYLTSLTILEDKTCCRDFDNDGNIDNVIGGDLLKLAKQFAGLDVNANVQAEISAGRLVYLLEYRNWDNASFDPMMNMGFVTGIDNDADFSDNAAGTGTFIVDPLSFDLAGIPNWNFGMANVNNSAISGKNGTLDITFPGLIDSVQLSLVDVQINAQVEPGANLTQGGTVQLTQGTLSGALVRDTLFESMNDVSTTCPCLGNKAMFEKRGNGSYACTLTAADETACMSASQDCKNISVRQICSTLSIISPSVDVDSDGDGTKDSYSVGATFETVPAILTKP